jgi:hypothetical protein
MEVLNFEILRNIARIFVRQLEILERSQYANNRLFIYIYIHIYIYTYIHIYTHTLFGGGGGYMQGFLGMWTIIVAVPPRKAV